MREGRREMYKVEEARGETRFPFIVLDLIQDSRFSHLKHLLHCHIRGSSKVKCGVFFFLIKLVQRILKTIGVKHEKIFRCLTPNPTGSIQFWSKFSPGFSFSGKFSCVSRNLIQVSDLVHSQYFIEIQMQKIGKRD